MNIRDTRQQMAIIFSALVVVALSTPPERTLGALIKIVLVHGALTWVGQVVFVVAGILSVAYFLRGYDRCWDWSWAVGRVGLVFWVINAVLGTLVTYLAWGGITWTEPRWVATQSILLIAIAGAIIPYVVEKRWAMPAANIFVAAAAIFLIARAQGGLHPPSPVMRSDDIIIKAAFFIIFILEATLATLAASYVQRGAPD